MLRILESQFISYLADRLRTFQYSFFGKFNDAALNIFLREKQIILEFLERIRQELERCIDRHSKKIISKYIELLLDYCTRFYERQFITRSEVNKKVFREFNHLLDNHFNVKVSLSTDVLSDEYCANLLHLSPAYFNDLLKGIPCLQNISRKATLRSVLPALGNIHPIDVRTAR